MAKTTPQVRKARLMRRWMTAPEDHLWQALRGRRLEGLKFRRKVPLGEMTVDFYCPAASLVVEITGKGQHPLLLEKRDASLLARGCGVIRLSREEVLAKEALVLCRIAATARARA